MGLVVKCTTLYKHSESVAIQTVYGLGAPFSILGSGFILLSAGTFSITFFFHVKRSFMSFNNSDVPKIEKDIGVSYFRVIVRGFLQIDSLPIERDR